MSTTYYLEGKGECPYCGNCNAAMRIPVMHSACGWKLRFFSTETFPFTDPFALIEHLLTRSNYKLVDEYGGYHSAQDLMRLVAHRKQDLDKVYRDGPKVLNEGPTWVVVESDELPEPTRRENS